ncbi:hypothetical protein V1520DRAFT_279560, partial [Lipomyces starkeyi]
LWLNEFKCPTCILFWLNESPRFGYPRGADIYSATEHSAFDEAMQQARNNHPFGPYSYRDHSWFGPLTKAFIEVFKRDASTGDIESTEHVSSEIQHIETLLLVINLIDGSREWNMVTI